MTHLRKITLTSLFVLCVGMTTHVMANGRIGGGSHDMRPHNEGNGFVGGGDHDMQPHYLKGGKPIGSWERGQN